MNLEQFLNEKSKYPGLYHEGLEAQIFVAEDDGERVGKGFKKGSDFWYHFRKTSSKDPKYDIAEHAESIGVTGWNWKNKVSEFVGFDFDSLVGHKKGLTDEELLAIKDKASSIPWITVRRSTSGNGLHFYVHFRKPIDTCDRREHALLAEAILSNLSILVEFDFKRFVDKSGGILWIWSRRANKPRSFELIKQGAPLEKVPPDWKERALREKVKSVAQNVKHLKLSNKQKELISWFNKQLEPGQPGATWWWDAEMHMLVCHTYDLARAHEALNLRGIFETISTGKDCPNDQNCFAFPIKNDAWVIRRHSPGTTEATSWHRDKSGWTFCFYNRIPSLTDLSRTFGGNLTSKGDYSFRGEVIQRVLDNLLVEDFTVDERLLARNFRIKKIKGAKIVLSCDRLSGEPELEGWVNDARKYEKVLDIIVEDKEVSAPDDLLRYVVADETGSGWFLNTKDMWIRHDKGNIADVLTALGHDPKTIKETLGQCIMNPWVLVNEPFGPEYLGDRLWNKYAAQLAVSPEEGDWSFWKDILKHLGRDISGAVAKDGWCKLYGITTGGEYLKLWIASMIQYPMEPLPYLFFYGDQLTGKSTFFEMIDECLVRRGVANAGIAIASNDGFNKEIAGSVLCYIDEVDLSTSKVAYSRVKEWITAKKILVHEKKLTPLPLDNSTHWVHCANDPAFCPVSMGDTRIMFIHVPKIEVVLTKTIIFERLKEQAPAFLFEILHNTDIPPAQDRLRIPLIDTADKREEQVYKASDVVKFITEKCFIVPGHLVSYAEFCEKFSVWTTRPDKWNQISIGKAIPKTKDMPVKGRSTTHKNAVYLGNITFDSDAKPLGYSWEISDGKLTKTLS